MFIAALFLTTQKWKHPKYPLTDRWVKKMYINAMEYYLAIKRSGMLIHTTVWMNLENIISEKSQTQKAACCVIPFVSRTGKSIETESTSVITKAGGTGE